MNTLSCLLPIISIHRLLHNAARLHQQLIKFFPLTLKHIYFLEAMNNVIFIFIIPLQERYRNQGQKKRKIECSITKILSKTE